MLKTSSKLPYVFTQVPHNKVSNYCEAKVLSFPKEKISEKFILNVKHIISKHFHQALKYKRHLIPSLCSCLFIWDNQTTVDKRPAQELSIHVTRSSGQNICRILLF